MPIGELLPQPERALDLRSRPPEITHLEERDRQIGAGLGVVRSPLHRPVQDLGSRGVVFPPEQGVAEQQPGFDRVGIGEKRPAPQRLGTIIVLCLEGVPALPQKP